METKKLSLLLISILTTLTTSLSYATSQDECAIWLCAPAGFPSPECNGAHSEFKHRIKHGKSPFPSLSSCMDNGVDNSGLYVVNDFAAVIPAHQEQRCLREESRIVRSSYRGPYTYVECVEYETYTVPTKYVIGTGCIHGQRGPESNTPKNCTATMNVITVHDQNGDAIGSPFFY